MPDGGYLVGATVRLLARLSVAGTRDPATATVSLASVTRSGVTVTGLPTSFTLNSDGLYELPIDTTGLPTGTYNYVVRADGGTNAISLAEGVFSLRVASALLTL